MAHYHHYLRIYALQNEHMRYNSPKTSKSIKTVVRKSQDIESSAVV